jgi:hypothetical protein
MKKKKADATDTATADDRTYLDKLIDLRNDIKGSDGLTALLDILIDAEGGDSAALADAREQADDDADDGGAAADPDPEA